jgi:hypothetical protein
VHPHNAVLIIIIIIIIIKERVCYRSHPVWSTRAVVQRENATEP